MPRVSLQYKIGFLLFIAVCSVVLIGYVSYRSLSSIVSSINIDAQPDYTLITLKEIALELEKAENSIRLFTVSKEERNLKPYYEVIFKIDTMINSLRESNPDNQILIARIDTISWLIKEKYVLWTRMVRLHESDNSRGKLESLSKELIQIDILSKNKQQPGIIGRIFKNGVDTPFIDHMMLAEKITAVESEDEQLDSQLKSEELKLAHTNREITSRFYSLMEELEYAEKAELKEKALRANQLAKKTYLWLIFFLIAVTSLSLLVVFIVARYIRKTIASQKALEESKLEAEKLARVKEIFTANVSHEIRTPLNAIYGFLEQVDMNSMNDDNREKLKVVRTSSENLLRIVNEVLDFSKLQSGKLALEKMHFSIRSLIDEVFLLFNESATKNNSTIQVFVDPDVTGAFYSDPYRLKQVMVNLVGNAIKFTHNGKIEIDVYEENKTNTRSELIIRISDTGIGIAPDKLGVIFDDYTQGEAGTTQKYGGTGLGLSIVKKIISLFGGSIKVESRLNSGSTFICRIPQEKGDPSKISESSTEMLLEPPKELSNFMVLIADDEEYNRLLLKTILKKWNMPYEEAIDGIDAIEKIKSNRFQLALLDIRMPGIDGMKAANFIREVLKKEPGELPLVAITAAYSYEECEIYKKEGFNDAIRKPFSEMELLKVIVTLLNLDSRSVKAAPSPAAHLDQPSEQLNISELYRISNNDESFVKEMLITFINSYHQGIQQIDEKVEANEYLDVAEVAHKICSPCRHLGADKLWSLTKKLENECKSNIPNGNISKLVVDLKNEFHEIEKQINKKLEHINP